ncbi:MAG: toprim domain-containing protein, partial [Nitrospirota bacterium]|nr:toprim domain-containing protein [Nitrospirota bacterium]
MSGLTPARLDSFCHAMEAAGLVPPDPIIADGTLHRFPTNGRPDDDAGWYVLYGDGIPAGTFGCWRYGVKESWCAKSDQQMTRAEWTAHQRRIEKIQRDREAEDQRRHAEAAAKAQWIWDSATPAPDDHPYLQRKQVKAHGLRVDDQHGLLIPVMINGAISSLQFIDANGGKLLLYGGAKKGGSFTIGTMTDNAVICIAEGYATAATIHEATGYPAVVAFDAGNLLPVAQALRAKNHDVTIIVCADNDVRDDGTPNTGREDATAAAEAIGGVLALPELDGKKCDFNDVHVQRGLDAVEAAIDSALQEQATMMTPTLSVEKIPEAAHYTPSAVTAQLHTEPTREEALIRLAQLSPADYGAARKAASATLGIPLGFLDKEWEARRAQAGQAGDAGHGLALEFEETVPAFEPVGGADLADRLAATFTKFTVLPDHGAVALTLWVLFTYCLDLFQIAPRLDLSSPEKRCGKTTVLSLLSRLVARAALASNIRPAVLFRV